VNKFPTAADIVKALHETGFILEQDIATKLESLGFNVETNWPFPDIQEGKSREIDIRATHKIYSDEVEKISVFIELLIECKDTVSPWAFVCRKKNPREQDHSEPREYIFPSMQQPINVAPNSVRFVPTFVHHKLAETHYYYREKNKTTQFAKIVSNGRDGWVANRDGVHDGLVLPLAKLLDFRRLDPIKFNGGGGWRYVWLYFPIVAVNNSLFLFDPSIDKQTVTETKRATYVRQIDSENIKGTYLIDFVAAAHIGDYVQLEVMNFANSLVEKIKVDPKVFG
jgi:hypothetical protein